MFSSGCRREGWTGRRKGRERGNGRERERERERDQTELNIVNTQ
jgi:hypothetical protein